MFLVVVPLGRSVEPDHRVFEIATPGEVLAVESPISAVSTGQARWVRAEMTRREGQMKVVHVGGIPALSEQTQHVRPS